VPASASTNIGIGLAVLAFVLYRQLQPRPVRDNMRLPLILAPSGSGLETPQARGTRAPPNPSAPSW
jgi:hypothetical protein